MKFFVCLDIGCNWALFEQEKKYNITYAEEMIHQAKDAGVDAVKFQYFNESEIKAYEEEHPPSKYTPEMYDVIARSELTLFDLSYLAGVCDKYHIEFMCTPFINPLRVTDLNPLVKRWKIRERDNDNKDLLYACLRTRKPTYRSQAALDFDATVELNDDLRQVFVIPKYPATYIDFAKTLGTLDLLGAWEGYSNHIKDPAAVLLACSHALDKGREFYVEAHFKLAGTRPVDDAVSFDDKQVKTIVEVLRSWEKALPLMKPKQESLYELF